MVSFFLVDMGLFSEGRKKQKDGIVRMGSNQGLTLHGSLWIFLNQGESVYLLQPHLAAVAIRAWEASSVSKMAGLTALD